MPIGPGKYDEWCTRIREKHRAEAVILIVHGGDRGEGFDCQMTLEASRKLPSALRQIADEIEFTLASGEDTN